jgi:hypothetical protein
MVEMRLSLELGKLLGGRTGLSRMKGRRRYCLRCVMSCMKEPDGLFTLAEFIQKVVNWSL